MAKITYSKHFLVYYINKWVHSDDDYENGEDDHDYNDENDDHNDQDDESIGIYRKKSIFRYAPKCSPHSNHKEKSWKAEKNILQRSQQATFTQPRPTRTGSFHSKIGQVQHQHPSGNGENVVIQIEHSMLFPMVYNHHAYV